MSVVGATSDPDYHHRGFFGRLPSKPHDLTSRITPTAQAIVLCHLDIPRLSADGWRLSIGGLVRWPLIVTFDDLLAFEKCEVLTSVPAVRCGPMSRSNEFATLFGASSGSYRLLSKARTAASQLAKLGTLRPTPRSLTDPAAR
jgi:hypothetical protein